MPSFDLRRLTASAASRFGAWARERTDVETARIAAFVALSWTWALVCGGLLAGYFASRGGVGIGEALLRVWIAAPAPLLIAVAGRWRSDWV
ncbi:MAG: hypothetical protein AAGL49_11475, partial [Pseudomonadota bacterium]